MTFGSLPFGESTFAGSVLIPVPVVDPGPGTPIGGPAEEPIIIDPFTITISDISFKPLVNTLSIDLEFGRQGTASFTLVNPEYAIQIGEPVIIQFYDDIIFSGSIDSVRLRSNNQETFKTYECECVDHISLLLRQKIKRSYANITLWSLTDSAINEFLGGDGVTLDGNMPVSTAYAIPSVDADNVSIYDMLYDAAVSVGVSLTIDHDKVIHYLGADVVPAPMTIDENIATECEVNLDRDAYRNYQTVYVTGTPASNSEDGVTVLYTTSNGQQISDRATIEGNNGVYSESESITHPTSNDPATLIKLGVAYALTSLAVNGNLRETLTVSTRQYGFKVGQTATVSIPQLGRTGSWFIRGVQMNDEAGRWLVSRLTLTVGSLRQRKQELWLGMARKGTVIVAPPMAAFSSSQTFSTPGSYTFTVPADITILQVTCLGAGGGGGGSAAHRYFGWAPKYGIGGSGGKGGKSITIISVLAGQQYTITVPSGGAGGTGQAKVNDPTNAQGINGANGGVARVSRGGAIYAEGYGGIGGIGAIANAKTGIHGIWQPSPDSGGTGTFITVGGGAGGGAGGLANPLESPSHAGSNGSVKVEW